MIKRYEIWAEGLRKLFFIAFIVGVIPLAITVFITLGLELTIYLLPGKIIDLSKYYSDIYLICLIIFGPYYLQKYWDKIIAKDTPHPLNKEIVKHTKELWGEESEHQEAETKRFSRFDASIVVLFVLWIIYALFFT